MFLSFKIRKLLRIHFTDDHQISRDCYWEIVKIMFNRRLFKQHKVFIYMVCDYKKRKGVCTEVQLSALLRINNG